MTQVNWKYSAGGQRGASAQKAMVLAAF